MTDEAEQRLDAAIDSVMKQGQELAAARPIPLNASNAAPTLAYKLDIFEKAGNDLRSRLAEERIAAATLISRMTAEMEARHRAEREALRLKMAELLREHDRVAAKLEAITGGR